MDAISRKLAGLFVGAAVLSCAPAGECPDQADGVCAPDTSGTKTSPSDDSLVKTGSSELTSPGTTSGASTQVTSNGTAVQAASGVYQITFPMDVTGAVYYGDVQWFSSPLLNPGRYYISMAGTSWGSDADIYVRFGAWPDAYSYDCRPYLNNSDESCVLDLQQQSVLYIAVAGYGNGASGYELQVSYQQTTGGYDPCGWGGCGTGGGYQPGVWDWQGTSYSGEEDYIQTPVLPVGTYYVIMHGDGDADLYVRAFAAPSVYQYDCRPYLNGTDEGCQVNLNYPGSIYAMVKGYATYSNYTLSIRSQ